MIQELCIGMRRFAALVISVSLSLVACTGGGDAGERGSDKMDSSAKIRLPEVAGQFYPGTEAALRDAVTSLLDEAEKTEIQGRIVGLVSPHAGYMYSGAIAARAYGLIRGNRYDAVVVIAPSHHAHFDGSSIYDRGPYRTPLGDVEIDRELAKSIRESDPSIGFHPQAHEREHSLEVQLPFLQVCIPDLKIIPIVMGSQDYGSCRRLARAIAEAVGDMNVLLVASSDLSHFRDREQARKLDERVVERISGYEAEELAEDLSARRCEACGGGPMVTVMLAARRLGADRSVILEYGDSGDVTGDMSNVVGYLSAAFVAGENVGVDLGLGHAEMTELLKIARQSIEARVLGKPMPALETDSEALKREMGAFVTITEEGNLRGCIGNIRGTEPLLSTVSGMAVAAAVEDPRFPPLTPEEVDRISIEISVLTPLEKIEDPDRIKVGRHGLYLEKGPNRGLLLPQVATDYGWDRYEFLDHTCLKAGLPKGAWREGATIYAFSAQVFNEGEVLDRP
jgi:hypothetical protein